MAKINKNMGIVTKLEKGSSPKTVTEKHNYSKESGVLSKFEFQIKTHPRSYRFRQYEIDLLKSIFEAVNKVALTKTGRKVETTKIIRHAIELIAPLAEKNSEKLLENILKTEEKSIRLSLAHCSE